MNKSAHNKLLNEIPFIYTRSNVTQKCYSFAIDGSSVQHCARMQMSWIVDCSVWVIVMVLIFTCLLWREALLFSEDIRNLTRISERLSLCLFKNIL